MVSPKTLLDYSTVFRVCSRNFISQYVCDMKTSVGHSRHHLVDILLQECAGLSWSLLVVACQAEQFYRSSVFWQKCCLLWSNKVRAKQKTYKSVGVMKDRKVKLREVHSSHTLGYTGRSSVYIRSYPEIGNLGEFSHFVHWNLSQYVCFSWCCLLWIETSRSKDKTYEWGSLWWETKR